MGNNKMGYRNYGNTQQLFNVFVDLTLYTWDTETKHLNVDTITVCVLYGSNENAHLQLSPNVLQLPTNNMASKKGQGSLASLSLKTITL